MTAIASMNVEQLTLWCFGLTVASAIFPWVNAELIVLALPAVTTSRTTLFLLVIVATLGQMTGKCALYWAGRRGNRILRGRAEAIFTRWRQRLEARPSRAVALVLVSAITGLPPFYLMTLLAGALRMNLLLYLIAGTTGRLIHFGVLVTIPHVAHGMFHGA